MTDTQILAHVAAEIDADTPHHRVDLHSGRHRLVADEPETAGGQDAGPAPFVLWLSGLASCTAMTLRMYAERKGWDLGGVEVDCTLLGGDEGEPHIERTIRFGYQLDDEQRGRLADIAEKTPVTKVVKAGTPIETKLL